MGLFDRFGSSFEKKVNTALDRIGGMGLGVKNLGASVSGKVVTLTGEAPSRDAATRVMDTLEGLVKPDNIVNTIRVAKPPEPQPQAAAPAPAEPTASPERIHEVVSGDTLGAIAKKYYGKASLYMKIFEANRDILDNPDLIKVGQKLRIPE